MKMANTRKIKPEDVFIPGSIGYYLNSFSPEDLRKKLENEQHLFRLGMQRYLATGSIPHCYILGFSCIKNGISIDEFINISKTKNIKFKLDSLLDVIKELEQYGLMYEKDNKLYSTEEAHSIIQEAKLLD